MKPLPPLPSHRPPQPKSPRWPRYLALITLCLLLAPFVGCGGGEDLERPAKQPICPRACI